MNDRTIPQHVLDAFWQRWGNNNFMRAQGLQVEVTGVGEAVVRLPQVLDWLQANPVDALALQETKLTDDKFPAAEIEAAGV